MDQVGRLSEKLDIKILILFVLRRLPGTVDPETLLELCQFDSGIDYFDYSDCLSELEETDHLTRTPEGYRITEKGARNADAVESSLPYSLRMKTLKRIQPVQERLQRLAMIVARHEPTVGGCMVELAMSDGKGEIIHLKLLCADDEQAEQIENNFRKKAEDYYQQFVQLLTGEEEKN